MDEQQQIIRELLVWLRPREFAKSGLPGCLQCVYCHAGYWPGNGATEIKHADGCLMVRAAATLGGRPEDLSSFGGEIDHG